LRRGRRPTRARIVANPVARPKPSHELKRSFASVVLVRVGWVIDAMLCPVSESGGMRIVLSIDMEGIAGVRGVRELLACCPEYWDTGRVRLTDDVLAAASGLLDGGASEVIVLDNHASGHPTNVVADQLPSGCRIGTDNVFDLPQAGIHGMLQVGYHPRRSAAGFAPHTYIPGLRLWMDEEEISESHGRVWAAQAPLLGITGHANHGNNLGSLGAVPFLAVQHGTDPHHPEPVFTDPRESVEAIWSFAREAMRHSSDALRPTAPRDATFAATLEHPDDAQVETMLAGGWVRHSDETFAVTLPDWAQARGLLGVAMQAAMAPFVGPLAALDMSSRHAIARQDGEQRESLVAMFLASLQADTGSRPPTS
jgi:D-aminopeptidase